VLTCGENLFVDLKMQVIGCAVVNDLNLGVGQQIVIVAVRFGDRQCIGLGLGQLLSTLRDGGDLNKTKSTQRLHVNRANETSANNACFDCHGWLIVDSG